MTMESDAIQPGEDAVRAVLAEVFASYPMLYRLREVIKGKCDGSKNVISRPNGHKETLGHPKNTGTCNLILVCKDRRGLDIEGSERVLAPGQKIHRYSTPEGTWTLQFECSSEAGPEECSLEIDALPGTSPKKKWF